MKVELIDRPLAPERTVCKAARGDYYDGFVCDDSYEDIMAGVDPDDHHVEAARTEVRESMEALEEMHEEGYEWIYPQYETLDEAVEVEATEIAKTRALLEQLLRRRHFGPWEHASLTIGVAGISRSCMAQITRHRHVTFDVQSQRYVDFSELAADAVMPETIRPEEQTVSREQGLVDLDEDERERMRDAYQGLVDHAQSTYETLLEHDVPKEDARFALPIGTPVNLTMSTNARSLMHIFDLRQSGAAQWEVRELSNELWEIFERELSYTAEYYEEHGPFGNAP